MGKEKKMAAIEYRRVISLEENGSNYAAWKFQLIIVLKYSGAYNVIENARTASKTEEEKQKWDEEDLKAQNLIVTSVHEKVITHLLSCKTAEEMWLRIESLYGKTTEARLHALQQKFYAYSYKNEGIASHIADLEKLSHELKNRGEEISENMLVNKILMT